MCQRPFSSPWSSPMRRRAGSRPSTPATCTLAAVALPVRRLTQSSSLGRVLPVFAGNCEQLRVRLNYWMPGDSCQLRYREGIQFEPTGSGARASRYVIWDTSTRACMGACGIKCTSSFCRLYPGCQHRSPIQQRLHYTIIRPSRSTNTKPLLS